MFKNKHGELRSGWAIVLSIIVMYILQFGIGIVAGLVALIQVGPDSLLSDPDAYMLAANSIAASPLMSWPLYVLMIAGTLLLFKLLYNRPLSGMGFFRSGFASHMLLGGLLGAAMMALSVGILAVTGAAALAEINWAGLSNGMFWAGLITYCFVGFSEEILSRGFMMTALKTTRNKWLIVLLPSAIFGLLHIFNPNVTFFSLVNIALVGVLFSYLFIRTGRLWAPIALHITWNFFQGYIFGIPVSGTAIPDSSLLFMDFTGPEWFTGGAFGVEGGAVCTAVILLGLLFTRFCVKRGTGFWSMDGDLPLIRRKKPGANNPVETISGTQS